MRRYAFFRVLALLVVAAFVFPIAALAEARSVDGGALAADEPGESAVIAADGDMVQVTDATITKTGDAEDAEVALATGANAAVLSTGTGSLVRLGNSTVETAGSGAAGLFAANSASLFANSLSLSTAGESSPGIAAAQGAALTANALNLTTSGDASPAVYAARGRGALSLVNATLATSGVASPLISAEGYAELNAVRGSSAASPIATLRNAATLLVNSSTLESAAEDPSGVALACAIAFTADDASAEPATFQSASSTLTSAVMRAAFFSVQGTSANLVLANTTLSYDHTANRLLQLGGSTSGTNAAPTHANLTTMNQQLEGDIGLDHASVEVWLRKGSTWTGTVRYDDGAPSRTGTATINVCPTSTWVLTESVTLARLTIKEGGQVIDKQGRTVPVLLGNKTQVEGTSPLTITLTDSFDTTFEVTSINNLATATMNRAAFDRAFGTSTAFTIGIGEDGADATDCNCYPSTAESDAAAAAEAEVESAKPWYQKLWETLTTFLTNLFG